MMRGFGCRSCQGLHRRRIVCTSQIAARSCDWRLMHRGRRGRHRPLGASTTGLLSELARDMAREHRQTCFTICFFGQALSTGRWFRHSLLARFFNVLSLLGTPFCAGYLRRHQQRPEEAPVHGLWSLTVCPAWRGLPPVVSSVP